MAPAQAQPPLQAADVAAALQQTGVPPPAAQPAQPLVPKHSDEELVQVKAEYSMKYSSTQLAIARHAGDMQHDREPV